MEYNEIYAKRIKEICSKRNLSIRQLAAMSGLRQSTVNNIMHGQSTSLGTVTIHKIANALNMTLSEFVNFKELNEYSFDENDQ